MSQINIFRNEFRLQLYPLLKFLMVFKFGNSVLKFGISFFPSILTHHTSYTRFNQSLAISLIFLKLFYRSVTNLAKF